LTQTSLCLMVLAGFMPPSSLLRSCVINEMVCLISSISGEMPNGPIS
jgi:hypothetical protein